MEPSAPLGPTPKQKKPVRWLAVARTVSRILTFLILPILFIDAYNLFRGLVRSASSGTAFDFSSVGPQLLTFLLLLGSSLLLGRFFCGWMCAFGSFGDLVHAIGRRWSRGVKPVPEKVDRWLKRVKYLVLLLPVALALIPGSPDLSGTSPWDAFGMLSSSLVPAVAAVAAAVPAGLLLLTLVAVGSLFVERFFCRYLCPLGAMFALVSRSRRLVLAKPTAACGSCRACTKRCAMGIALYKEEVVSSGECIQCLVCVESCPKGNIAFRASNRGIKPLTATPALSLRRRTLPRLRLRPVLRRSRHRRPRRRQSRPRNTSTERTRDPVSASGTAPPRSRS